MQPMIILAAVLTSSLVAATAQNEPGQCVSRQEFDTLKEQLARSSQETAAVKREVDSWQNSTILILKNPSVGQCACTTDIKQLWEKMDRVQDSVTANNASTQENATLQQQLLQYMQSLDQRLLLLQQQNKTLQRILQEQNRTLQEMAMLFSQNTVRHFPNGSFQNPAPSCKYIDQGSPSGYYWIQRPTTGYASQVYCDMTRRCNSTGGWMRVANFDMTNHTNHCPQGFTKITSPKRLCRRKSGVGCLSTFFPAHGTQYQKVCGRINGYQVHYTDAFGPYNLNHSITIDGTYIDGISITHGNNPRKHIWSFAAALDEVHADGDVCPCTKTDVVYTGAVPPFVGQDYFCDTGSRYHIQGRIYTHDPLWDGRGCGAISTCCSFNSPPWFCKQLPQPTTDDIELRLCNDQGTRDEDVLVEIVELYVQ